MNKILLNHLIKRYGVDARDHAPIEIVILEPTEFSIGYIGNCPTYGGIEEPDKLAPAINKLIRAYDLEEERRDWQENDCPADHIYYHLLVLQEFMGHLLEE